MPSSSDPTHLAACRVIRLPDTLAPRLIEADPGFRLTDSSAHGHLEISSVNSGHRYVYKSRCAGAIRNRAANGRRVRIAARLAPPYFVQFVVGELGDTAVWPLPDTNDHAYVNGPSPPLTETVTPPVVAVHPVKGVKHSRRHHHFS